MNTDDEAEVIPVLTIPGANPRRKGEIRVALKRWKGRDSLDIRWWSCRSGQARATIRGASIPIQHLAAFAEAVAEAARAVKAAEGPPS